MRISSLPEVVLASQSPRRSELLAQLGVRFRVLLPEDAERAEALEAVRAGESPGEYVLRVARDKALAAQAQLIGQGHSDQTLVLGADTTVAIGQTLLAKPVDDEDARRMLTCLSGRYHRVLTGVALVRGKRRETALSVSRVRFGRLTRGCIEAYLATGESRGKAGAYAIQGQAAAFVRRIEGSYSGIMGLPLHETARLLARFVRPD